MHQDVSIYVEPLVYGLKYISLYCYEFYDKELNHAEYHNICLNKYKYMLLNR